MLLANHCLCIHTAQVLKAKYRMDSYPIVPNLTNCLLDTYIANMHGCHFKNMLKS